VADINQETLKDTGGSAEGFYFTRINESMVKIAYSGDRDR
jgi:hypothetical protein